jgi:ammonium transporter, Amt family
MRAAKALITSAALAATGAAGAQPIVVADSGDSAWVLAASVFALLAAIPGLALLHGRGRTGPAAVSLFVAGALVSLLFAAIGYSLAFSPGGPVIGDAGNAMLANLAELRGELTISETLYALFQLVLALFATGIVVASLAERARTGWLVAFAGLWFLFVYVPVAHWLWGGGWLVDAGAVDQAGGIVVQLSAGISALVAAILLGRSGETELAHDSRLAVTGVALVWVGWFGVAGGAALSSSDDAASAIFNIHLAASAAALAGLVLERWRSGTVSVYGVAYAAIAGLAAMSAGAGLVGAGGAMALGIIGALSASLGSRLAHRLKLGGAASSFISHGAGAFFGAMLFPVFMLAELGGAGFDDGNGLMTQLVSQGIAVLSVALWSAGLTAVAALMVAMVIPMREKAA